MPVSYAADVAPIFRAHCSPCHTGDQRAGGLSLESFANLMKGGVSGPSVVKGSAQRSNLVERILGKGGLPRMPMGFKPLSPRDQGLIEAWINQGAKAGSEVRKHWAFVVPKRPPVPKVGAWALNPIDNFILAKLKKVGLEPSPPTDKVTLLRRVTLDLIGLPPTPSEVDAFMADRSPKAYERVVDRLLASPHYGERMALPWLDAARYADSNGYQQDGDTYQYVWRDWVVRALNANMPFDQFTIEQLAGDLLPSPTQDQLIATAFNRNHMLNGEGGAIAEEQRNVNLFDRVDTTAATWQGLTLACARCHDHKYDPLSQRDYFSMMAYFNQVPETGVPSGGGQYRVADPWIYAGTPAELKRLADAEATRARVPKDDNEGAARADAELAKLREGLPRVMVMSDAKPRITRVLHRGNYEEPLEEVKPAPPASLGAAPKLGNRLGLAKWIFSPRNPPPARGPGNRAWQLLFVRGQGPTEENFGVKGEPPTHPELLDWLAVEFSEKGWDVKRLHKLIVMSNTYRQSSKVTPFSLKRDPANIYHARAPRFRMPSMLLRDSALAASGLLNRTMGGKPVYPYQPAGIWDGLAITLERDFTYPQSKGTDNHRRSLYTFWRRTVAPGNMFDSSSRQVCTVKPSLTSTPLHALTMLNDVTWVEAGRALARSVIDLPASSRLSEAFRRVCARRPRPAELAILQRALSRSAEAFRSNPKAASDYLNVGETRLRSDEEGRSAEVAALAAVCVAIFNLDEAMTRE